MKSLELKTKREGLMAEMEALAKGTLDDAARAAFTEKEAQVVKLDQEIAEVERAENFLRQRAASSAQSISASDSKDINNYSLLKALREFKAGKLTGLEAEMHAEAERASSNMGGIMGLGIPPVVLMNKKVATRATLAAGSSPIVQTDNVGFIDAVWAKTLCVEMGAKTLSGLSGNLDLPYLATKPTVKWAGSENEAASDAAAALNKHSLTPKRITNYIPVSRQLMMQSNKSVEKILWDALIKATSVKIDAGAISGAGTTEPTGILNTGNIGAVVMGTHGGAPTLAKVLELIREVAVDDADIGALGFLTNPKVRYKLMQTPAVASTDSRMIWEVNMASQLLGYKVGVTTQVPSTLDKGTSTGVCSALVFGNWNDLTIAQFGAFDLILDDLTSAKEAAVNLITHSWWDVCVDHPESFAAVKDLTT